MALRFGKLEDALVAAGAPAGKAAEAAEEVANVVELRHRMERRMVRVEVLALVWSVPACLLRSSRSIWAEKLQDRMRGGV